MTPAKKQMLLKSLRYWAASYAVVVGLLYYKSSANLSSILIAGLLTLAITVGRAWMKADAPNPY